MVEFLTEHGIMLLWLGVAVISLIIESITSDMVSIWFTPGAILAMILSIWVDLFWLQLLIFLAISIIMLILARAYFKKHPILHDSAPMNADAVLEERGVVVEEINNLKETGAVKVKGMVWTARSVDDQMIARGEIVTIEQISGVKLICRLAESETKTKREV